MRYLTVATMILTLSLAAKAGEEKIRGVLEKTTKPDACAQITDALNEVYYVAKSDAAEKMVANFVGKNQKVELTGTIENKPNETVPFINLKTAEPFAPKLPHAPAPEKKDEKSADSKEEKADDKKIDIKK